MAAEPVEEPYKSDDEELRRQIFRAMIDYSDSFELGERHRGMILWRDGDPKKGVNFTNLFVQLVQDQLGVLGILPDDTANEWTLETFEQLMERFRGTFHVEKINNAALQPDGDGGISGYSGTAAAVLKHKLFSSVSFKIVCLKKQDHSDIFLVDNLGQSIASKKFKRIKVFTFEMVTNTDRLDDWDQCRQVKRRKRKSKLCKK